MANKYPDSACWTSKSPDLTVLISETSGDNNAPQEGGAVLKLHGNFLCRTLPLCPSGRLGSKEEYEKCSYRMLYICRTGDLLRKKGMTPPVRQAVFGGGLHSTSRNCSLELQSSALRTCKPRFHRLTLHRLHLQGSETFVRTCPTPRLVSPSIHDLLFQDHVYRFLSCCMCLMHAGKSSTNSACFCSW